MYLKHFGLTHDPFLLTPSTFFYCQIAQYEKVFGMIKFALKERDGFFLVVAEVGLGKTLLARRVLKALDNEEYHVCYVYNPAVSVASLSQLIGTELGIISHNQENIYSLIHERLIQLSSENKKIVLILDEAQSMSDEGLEFVRLLTNLETESFKLMQVIMLAQPEILSRLKQKNLRQLAHRMVYFFQLEPLNFPEVCNYIHQRMSLSGESRDFIFPETSKKAIWLVSKGNPRKINIIAKRALLSAYSRDASYVSVDDIKLAYKEVSFYFDNPESLSNTGNEQKKVIKKTSKKMYIFNILAILVVIILLIISGVAYERYF